MVRNIEEKLKQYRLNKSKESSDSSTASKSGRLFHDVTAYCLRTMGVSRGASEKREDSSASGATENTDHGAETSTMHKTDTDLDNVIKTDVSDGLKSSSESSKLPQASTVSRRSKRLPKTSLENTNTASSESNNVKDDKPRAESVLEWTVFALQFLLWLLLFFLFIKLEFGAVYFVFSMFYIMWKNFRSDRRKPYEPSAYSVFNPNCEAIDGTLSPEQFEREIRRGI